jgi:hypothetical protein
MDARTCVTALLENTKDIAEKAQALFDYLQWHSHFGTTMGIGARLGREFAVEQLFKALPAEQPNGIATLKQVFHDIQEHGKKQKQERAEEQKRRGNEIRSIAPGTQVVIRNGWREDIVRFRKMNRSRFIGEYPDGRLVSVPVCLFRRICDVENTESLDAANGNIVAFAKQ